MPYRGLALAAVLGALVAGCGGESPVEVTEFAFSPERREVAMGDEVTWRNTGEQIHNVKGKGFFSRAMDPGDEYSFTFERPGTYDYVCTLHPQMRGTVVVR